MITKEEAKAYGSACQGGRRHGGLYLDLKYHPYDCASESVIITEAGGVITTAEG